MSYNGSGTFTINSTGQPVVAGTVITASAFNALTTDLATGLTTAITKDGQTTTTARITFAQGLTSSLVTDSSSVSTGSIITDGGVGIAKNLYVGGTLNVTGSTSLTNPVINNIKMGYTTTATAAGTTTLTISSNYRQFFTGTLAQTIVLPVTSTLVTGIAYEIENNSTGLLTVNSSGGNLVGTVPAGVCAHAVCIGTTLTTAADWDWDYISTTTITGTGANVLGTSPTITTPTISSLSSAAATALTLQSAGTTAITVDTSQNVGIGTASPTDKLTVPASVRFGATSVIRTLYLGQSSPADNGSGSFEFQISNIVKNWAIRTNYNVAGALEFCPSTAAGGTTYTTPSMIIDSSGNVAIGTTSPANNVGLTIARANTGDETLLIRNTSASGVTTAIQSISFAYTPNNSTARFLYCGDSVAERCTIRSNGGIANYSANNVNLASDLRLKHDIEPIKSYWNVFKSLEWKTWLYNDQTDDTKNIGVIAQELQTLAPELVCESNVFPTPEGESPYLGLWENDFKMAAMSVITELVKRCDTQAETINALTARITALENA
jgi:hypothetical protein